jgi:two-component system phosphate regulon sensor histidine kinase PhoR
MAAGNHFRFRAALVFGLLALYSATLLLLYSRNWISRHAAARAAESAPHAAPHPETGRNDFLMAGLFLLGVVTVGGFFWGYVWPRSLASQLDEIGRVAPLWERGRYGERLRRYDGQEMGDAAERLNGVMNQVEREVESLLRDRARLSIVLSQMVEGVVSVDNDGRIVMVNDALCRIFDLETGAITGRHFLEALRHSQLNELMSKVLAEDRSRREEVRTFSPDERIFEAYGVPLQRQGRRVGALLVLHDVTRLRMLEQLRRDFVANVSHELRTPLASIKGFAETLRLGALDDKENRLEFVEAIENQATRMNQLVDDLLDLAAVESGQRAMKREPLDLFQIARDVARGVKPVADRRRVTVAVAENAPAVTVFADKIQMKQVLTNLIDNAIKFNREGGEVAVSGEVRGGRLLLSVRDSGAGIPAADLPRIFERFYRVDKARSRELGGTGLGLAIVKHIVEIHGGSVSVQSQENEGATFLISLPVDA